MFWLRWMLKVLKKINRDNHKKLESSKLSIILLWFVFYICTYIFNKTTGLSYRKKKLATENI